MTSLSFLIDTDWVIDHFNAVAHVTRRLKELEPRGLGLSVITAAELWEGVYFSRDPKRSQVMLEEFLSGVVVLGLDEEICRRFGQLRGSLRTWTDHRRFRSSNCSVRVAASVDALNQQPETF